MIIYRDINGVKTLMHNIEVDSQTELRQSISGEDLISSRFTIEGAKLDIQLGDYVEFKDSVYTILDEPEVKKSQNTFSYFIEFKSDQYILKNVAVLNPEFTESEFFLFGDAIDMVSLIISNLNRVYTDGAYYADFVEETEGKNISFNNENCLSAIQRLSTEFGCEFSVKGKKITFKEKIGTETNLTFQYKKELREITRQSLQNAELLTVLYPYGSTRNITNEYGNKRLTIPKIENNVNIFGTIERSVTFEDIYPRLNGNISAVYENINAFSDTAIDFDINDQLIGGVKAKVIFNTGDLSGREFEIKRYTHSTKQVELLPYTDDTDLTLPNATFRPRVGDKYVFVGIKMPQAYIDNAEAELLERATEYINKYSQPNVIYKVTPNYPALRANQTHLNLGDIITLKDDDFGIEFQTRILKLTQKLHNEYEYSLDIGNHVTVTYFTQVMNDQKNIRNNIYLNQKYNDDRFNRVYNNIKGFTAPLYVNRGEFNPANYYYNNLNRRDYVFRYDINENKEWYFYIGEDHQRAEWIEANWAYIGDQFEILATQTLLAENANIGKWLIQNGQIVSQATHNDYPRVHLNGEEGYAKFTSGVEIYGDAGYRDYTEEITIDSRTGEISARREGDAYQLSAASKLSSNGLFANFAGIDALPPSTGVQAKGAIVGLGFGKLSKTIWQGIDFIAGVIGRAENSASNPAPAYGGVFWGLKSFGRYKGVKTIGQSETSYTVQKYDEVIICYNTGTLSIQLPENEPPGREIRVRRVNDGVVIKGKGANLITDVAHSSVSIINKGSEVTFFWDGSYWLCNVKGKA